MRQQTPEHSQAEKRAAKGWSQICSRLMDRPTAS